MLNLISIKKYISPRYGVGYIVKTVFSAVSMGVVVYFVYNLLYSLKTGSLFVMLCALLVSVLVGIIVYFTLLLLTSALKKQDIEFMPKAELIIKVIGKYLKN
jgi:peptidoglycan biosynthesis protein MviN/MurJ (putative lipid II flippase)